MRPPADEDLHEIIAIATRPPAKMCTGQSATRYSRRYVSRTTRCRERWSFGLGLGEDLHRNNRRSATSITSVRDTPSAANAIRTTKDMGGRDLVAVAVQQEAHAGDTEEHSRDD